MTQRLDLATSPPRDFHSGPEVRTEDSDSLLASRRAFTGESGLDTLGADLRVSHVYSACQLDSKSLMQSHPLTHVIQAAKAVCAPHASFDSRLSRKGAVRMDTCERR